MQTAVIVQARMGSSRLPRKVMQELAGKPVLAHVLLRCREIAGADTVVCTIPDDPENAPLAEVADQCGAGVYQGSEDDVLDRYLGAARAVGAEVVMRVTSDCPLIDPQVCAGVLALRKRDGADYGCNNMPRTFPHGLDCEAFTVGSLAEAAVSTRDRHDREHVTPWLRRAPHLKRVNLASGDPALGELRWTLDYPEDMAFLRAVFSKAPKGCKLAMADVLAILAEEPEIIGINAMRRH